MADNNNAVIKVGTGANGVIDDINHNFKVVTQRIKDLNLSISYMDLLRIQEVYNVHNTGETDEERMRRFVANCWNTLPNYSAAAFTGEPLTEESYLFTFLGNKITENDYLVKLPDNQCLFIRGFESYVYKPEWDSINNRIVYTRERIDEVGSDDENPAPETVQIPIEIDHAVGNTNVTTGDLPDGVAVIKDARWFINNEEVLWSGSHTATTPPPTMPTANLTHIFIY